jgi:[acyl-carrier-protein] S-malonyltransferase
VLSGEKAACAKAIELIEAAGGKPVPLAVAGAFHTPLMESACERLSAALNQVKLISPRIPVVSNVDAQPHTDPDDIRRVLVKQVVSPVLWEDAVRWLISQGADRFYEIGPGKVLKGLMRRIDKRVDCQNVGEG